MTGKLLKKELKLSASLLSYLFILFGFIALFPGYPILLSAFFISFGIFQSFQSGRENNDIIYTALLPAAKSDVVKAKFIFCIFIEACGFILILALTLIRMTLLKDAAPYRSNALMNANFVFDGFALLIFGCFNLIFVRGFFKTAYKLAKPFVVFIIISFVIVGIAETLHHIPGFEKVNSFGFDNIPIQLSFLIAGLILYLLFTFIAYRLSVKSFEKIDL